MTTSVGVLDHYNVRTRNLDATVRFYADVLGLTKGPRPDFAVPGAWMYSEGRPVVHLVDISATDEAQKTGTGTLHHVAFISTGFEAMQKRLATGGTAFRTAKAAGGDIMQIFVTDPNGVVIELNYDITREKT